MLRDIFGVDALLSLASHRLGIELRHPKQEFLLCFCNALPGGSLPCFGGTDTGLDASTGPDGLLQGQENIGIPPVVLTPLEIRDGIALPPGGIEIRLRRIDYASLSLQAGMAGQRGCHQFGKGPDGIRERFVRFSGENRRQQQPEATDRREATVADPHEPTVAEPTGSIIHPRAPKERKATDISAGFSGSEGYNATDSIIRQEAGQRNISAGLPDRIAVACGLSLPGPEGHSEMIHCVTHSWSNYCNAD